MEYRHILHFQEDGQLNWQRGKGSLPLIGVLQMGRERPILEIGVNIPHKRAEREYFQNLAQDIDGLLSPEQRYAIIRLLPEIILGDPSLSTFSFARPSVFSIHISDPSLEAMLDQEAQRMQSQEIKRRLDRENHFPSQAMLREITRHPEVYGLVLFALNPEERPVYHTGLKRIARKQRERFYGTRDAQRVLKEMKVLQRRLLEKGFCGRIESAIIDVEEEIRKEFLPIKEEALDQLLESWNPEEADVGNCSIPDVYAGIERTRTTLHQRAHANYAQDILTYRCVEAWERVERRKALIRAANQNARVQGREVKPA